MHHRGSVKISYDKELNFFISYTLRLILHIRSLHDYWLQGQYKYVRIHATDKVSLTVL